MIFNFKDRDNKDLYGEYLTLIYNKGSPDRVEKFLNELMTICETPEEKNRVLKWTKPFYKAH